MVKPLPLSDFRAQRNVLEEDDYAISAPEIAPTDLIEPAVWVGIMNLPDDIAVQVSNHHGRQLKFLYDLWGEWIEAVGEEEKDNLFGTMLDAADCFQCATFSLLHGYYRSALSDLRTALELVMIGTYGSLRPSEAAYTAWKANTAQLQLPSCRRLLLGVMKNDGLPGKGLLHPDGIAVTRYYDLSRFSHSRPDGSDGALLESNGPVYNEFAVRLVFDLSLATYAACFLLAKIGRPALLVRPVTRTIFNLHWVPGHAEMTPAFEELFGERIADLD